uniref:Uncharacterized protein n=2 Tax=Cacopsylla melanoneura TaxID=428564 RepID=A0A8D9BR57_9HEMI
MNIMTLPVLKGKQLRYERGIQANHQLFKGNMESSSDMREAYKKNTNCLMTLPILKGTWKERYSSKTPNCLMTLPYFKGNMESSSDMREAYKKNTNCLMTLPILKGTWKERYSSKTPNCLMTLPYFKGNMEREVFRSKTPTV